MDFFEVTITETVVKENKVFTVSQLNEAVKRQLESTYPAVYITGEVSNLSRPASGHLYFSLKDKESQIRCAFFKGYQRNTVSVQNGDQVKVLAQVSLYPDRGDYQLIVRSLELDGLGSLQQQFDALKKKLQQEGLFDPSRKKPLPRFPRRIGLITSETGAALQDMLHIFERRYPIVQLILFPSMVQGADAPPQLIKMLLLADQSACDCLIIARGGGSLEDLWAFNDEKLARTIAALHTPIISGVGHEIDFTLTDFVADIRAPTPSAAAEIATPDRQEILSLFEQYAKRFEYGLRQRLIFLNNRLHHLSARLRHPRDRLHIQQQRLDFLSLRLQETGRQQLHRLYDRFRSIHQRFQMIHPTRRFEQIKQKLTMLKTRLLTHIHHLLERKRLTFLNKVQTLNALSPLQILERGYTVVTDDQSHIVRSVTQLKIQDRIYTRFKDGTIMSVVEKIMDQ